MQRVERGLLRLVASGALVASWTAGGSIVSVGEARAEKVESRRPARVFSSPGELSRVVVRVRAGKEMQVLQRRNRWLRVRVNGRTGWIPRTNVVEVELDPPPPRRTRRPAFVEGRGSRPSATAPRDRVGADATDEGALDEEIDAGEDSWRGREESWSGRAEDLDRSVAFEPGEDELAGRFEEADPSEAPDDASGRPGMPDTRRQMVVVRVDEAVLREDPSPSSALVDSAERGTRLVVLEREGDWIKVQRSTGETGWLRESRVDRIEAAPRRPAGAAPREPGAVAKRASAVLGYAALGQKFHSTSDDPRGTYKLSSGAAVLGLSGELVYDSGDAWLLAADLAYRHAIATPGIRYTDPLTMNSADIGFKRHQLELRGRAGHAVGDPRAGGMLTWARVGLLYDNLRIDDVDDLDRNLARLPSEVLTGITVGAMVEAPRLSAKWAARAEIETLALLATRTQTTGLEDGAASEARLFRGGAALEYAWDGTYKVTGEYQYAYAKTSWSGSKPGSMRSHMAEAARRKDSTHVLLLGVGRAF